MCNLDWFPSIAIAVAWSRCEYHWVPILKPTRTALCTSWIRECPETSAKALCESLIMAIECARVTCYEKWVDLGWVDTSHCKSDRKMMHFFPLIGYCTGKSRASGLRSLPGWNMLKLIRGSKDFNTIIYGCVNRCSTTLVCFWYSILVGHVVMILPTYWNIEYTFQKYTCR